MTNIIFVLGGVISGLGKGVTSSSIGAILQEIGYKNITIKKIDPYLNIDPGTMNPREHGEVYVTEDGAETDLDLGYYERFTSIKVTKKNSISAGRLFYNLLKKERRGDFLGKTVQLIPHFTNEIKNFILADADKYDFIVCEVGGSAGDYEAAPFLEAVRQIKKEYPVNVMICLVSYLIYYQASKELKTKPTQVAIQQLMSVGIQPDVLFIRSERKFGEEIKEKLSLYTNIKANNIIPALNFDSIYKVPLAYIREGLIESITDFFNLNKNKTGGNQTTRFEKWLRLSQKIDKAEQVVNVGIVGKYVELEDAYYSVIEALQHAGWDLGVQVKIKWINARTEDSAIKELETVNCVVVPGGFGSHGIEYIIKVIQQCRENDIPFLGICLGMQLAVIEFARNILGISNASSEEFGNNTDDEFIIHLINKDIANELGGTLRLGNYEAILDRESLAFSLYQNIKITERHRHRYEVNIEYKDALENKGLLFSGISPDGLLTEIVEIKNHRFFIAGQFHPEFNSTPFSPHPLFLGLLKAAKTR